MAKIALIGLEPSTANQIRRALQNERHEIELLRSNARAEDIINADIIFANGSGKQCLTLLRGLRRARPSLPFVIVTMNPEPTGWLDALEAGATDYCTAPLESRHINWVMESALHGSVNPLGVSKALAA